MSTPLEAALDAINAVSADPIIIAKCRALMRGYDARWRDQKWECVSAEEVWHLPIMNPDTGHPKRTFTQSGKIDLIVRRPGEDRRYLVDHKTCGEDVSDPSALYWQVLAVDSQLSAYMLAKAMQGERLEGAIYDVINKPKSNPKAIAKGDERKRHKVDGKLVEITPEEKRVNNFGTIEEIVVDGTYFGTPVECMPEAGDTESPELYEARITYDILNRLEYYFVRKCVPRLDSDIVEYATELVQVADAISHARAKNAHFRNDKACRMYGSPCEYLGICSGYDSPDSDRWTKANEVHTELVQLDDCGGRNVLTNSRIKTFQLCRRKHYYRYEIGIRRVDREESDNLALGSCLHLGLERYWLELKPTEESNVNRNESGQGGTSSTQTELAF